MLSSKQPAKKSSTKKAINTPLPPGEQASYKIQIALGKRTISSMTSTTSASRAAQKGIVDSYRIDGREDALFDKEQ